MSLAPGTRIGPYEIVSMVGAGGMGEVYRATDLNLKRDVAIKVLPEAVGSDAERLARFQREAEVLASLNHPNIGAIYGLERTSATTALVLELVEGPTLSDRIARGKIPIDEVLPIARQIAEALEGAHEHGIIHRDLKPANIKLRPDGVVKVLDFGLAKALGSDSSVSYAQLANSPTITSPVALTGVGALLGTAAYISPEQAKGKPPDKRADIWAFGCILFEMLTGRRTFEGETATETLARMLERQPDWGALPPTTPEPLRRLVRRCLEKQSGQRLRDIGDARLEIEEILTVPPAIAATQRPANAEAAAAAVRRYKQMAAAALAALLVVIGVGGWWATRIMRERTTHAARAPLTSRGLTRLTFDPGLQSEITWSPDGRFIAYASDRTGNFDIWVQPVGGGAAVQLTKSPAHDREPSWSPDGTAIVFRSDRAGGGLFVISPRGGAERQLSTFGVGPKWAPDGSQILFVTTSAHALLVPRLFTVRLDGQPPQPVLQSFLRNMRYVVSWNWYPDSKRISLLGARTFAGEGLGVYTVPLSGEGAVLLKYTPEVGSWGGFDWSPSGRSLYVDCNSNWAHGLCRLEVDPSTMTIRSTQRITAGTELVATPVLSRDGRRLAYTMARGAVRLWTIPFDSATGRVAGAGQAITEGGLYVRTSSLSYDGTRLAYVANRVGTARTEFWMTDLARGRHRQLTDDDQGRITPQWSRDGHTLAYGWFERPGDQKSRQALAIRSTDSQEEQLISTPQLVTGWAVAPFDWSLDGRSILASSVVPHPPVHSLTLWPLGAAPRAETALKTVAYDPQYDLWQARYSPDGKWICFVAVEREITGGNTIFVMPSGGGQRSRWTPLTDSREWADKPRWSPDGKLVYFLRYRNSFFNVWAVRFDGTTGHPVGEPFQITRFESPTHQISPDLANAEIGVSSNRLILTIMEQAGNIWVLDNVDQ